MNAPIDRFLIGSVFDPRFVGAVVGTLLAFDPDSGEPLVTFDGQPGAAAVRARSAMAFTGDEVGRPAVLLFEGGDPAHPLLMGVLQTSSGAPATEAREPLQVEGDGARLTIAARDRLVLRCGRASLTLTHAGTVLLEGSYVVSRATGTLRIQGGSVQIN